MKTIVRLAVVMLPLMSLISCADKPVILEQEIIASHKAIFTHPAVKIPVTHAVDAPMMGNGYTGVAISGPPEKQVYYIARNDFWRLKSSYNESFPAVLGKLVIDLPDLQDFTYRVEQDLYTAVTHTYFTQDDATITIKSFVSATQDVMILEIQLTGMDEMEGAVYLDKPDSSNYPTQFDIWEEKTAVSLLTRTFNKDVDIPTKAAIALKTLKDTSQGFKLTDTETLIMVCAFSSNFKSDDCIQAALSMVKNINPSQLKKIEKEHKQWWADFWSKSWVDLNDSIIEHQYFLSNYTLASFSRDPDFPPSIFGTCITKERPAWNGDYHLNYNHMAPYYGLYSSNHIEQANPYNAPILAFMDRGQYYSKMMTGIVDGIMLPVGIGPLGIETTRRNAIMDEQRSYTAQGNEQAGGLFFGQKSNASYAVVNMAMQFYHTYDLGYAERIYPFVRQVATFWEKYLTYENNRYVIYHDAIHEGSGKNVNPILSLGLVRLVMQTAIDMSRELKTDEDRVEKWQHILDHLSDYSYQEREGKKVFRYSEEGTAWWVNNTLGIQHIYPAGQIGLDSDPELLQTAHNTIEVMQRWIDNNGSNSYFPAAVRVGYDPVIILDNLYTYISHTYPNGFQLNNPHGIENLSTVPNTINEMLCQSHEGLLRVFPVWPNFRNARFHSLRTYGAFLVSSEITDGTVQYVTIISEKGRDCRLENPWPEYNVELTGKLRTSSILSGEVLTFETTPGEKIELRKQ